MLLPLLGSFSGYFPDTFSGMPRSGHTAIPARSVPIVRTTDPLIREARPLVRNDVLLLHNFAADFLLQSSQLLGAQRQEPEPAQFARCVVVRVLQIELRTAFASRVENHSKWLDEIWILEFGICH